MQLSLKQSNTTDTELLAVEAHTANLRCFLDQCISAYNCMKTFTVANRAVGVYQNVCNALQRGSEK